ncbi:MAG: nucleotidyltransferase substrate binding protein [Methanobrevibacter sp.]|nr:nucleotidyltransferase substrate binding protein [Candidatus Methanovirga aequatorialis]
MEKKLDLTSLLKAYNSYINALEYVKMVESEDDSDNPFYTDEMVRAGLIQHFEYLYELSWITMKKFIKIDEGREDSLTRKGFFRHAGERGLIDDYYKWMEFHNARNSTSHMYDEEIAEKVYISAKEFDKYVKKFILVLEEKVKDL